ncbi:MAG: isoprenylcysteine carboxylmethyltransferase family protein [Blastocatellia bacterium]|nr:isoprenylcysteine carboxylmethyltransferase family protein [Blastocatellia bacterium]
MIDEQTINIRAKLQRLRVPLGFISVVLFVFASQPSSRSILAGMPIAFIGALIRAWASGHLRKNAALATSGPYAYTRNPLYFGSFIMAVGCAVCGGSWWLGLWLVGFFLLVYLPVMRAEAEHISKLFPADYERWAANVPLFFPRLTPYRGGAGQAFDLQQYLRHREYRASIGLAIVIGILTLKAVGV